MRMLAGVSAVGAVALSLLLVTPSAAAESAGCADVNGHASYGPPNGYSAGKGIGYNPITSNTFSAGEKITVSIAAVDNGGTSVLELQNATGSQSLLTMTLTNGATSSVTLPDGVVGLRFRITVATLTTTNLVVACTAAVASPAASSEESSDDVGDDLEQAAELTTAQTSALAVTNFATFVNTAVGRRFNSGPVGAPRTASTLTELLAPAQLMNAAAAAFDGGGAQALLLAGTQAVDNVLQAADRPFGLWLNGAATFVDYDKAGGAYNGTVLSIGGGADYEVAEDLIAGLAVSYERGDVDTAFNTGDLTSKGLSVAPYLGWRPIPELTVDASAGLAWLDYEMTHSSGSISGEYDALRVFGAANATGDFRYDKVRLSPLAGVLYFEEHQDGYSDSSGVAVSKQTVRLGRLKGGLEAGYALSIVEMEMTIEPYVRAEGEWDFIRPGAVTFTTGESVRPGRFGGSVAGGFNLSDGDLLSGNLEVSYDAVGREDFDSVTVQGTLRLAF